MRISGYDRHRCCCGQLARWQRTAPAVVSRAEWVALHAHRVRGAGFGVRQHGCRTSRACDHVEGAAVTPQLCAQWDHVSVEIPLPTDITRGATFGVRQPCCRTSRAHNLARGSPFPLLVTYALPTPGVNHGCTSGYDRHRYCCGRLARQCAAPAVLSRVEWIAAPARHARGAWFGVRQPCCRASRAHVPVRGTPFPLLVTGMLDVFITIIGAVRHECATCA